MKMDNFVQKGSAPSLQPINVPCKNSDICCRWYLFKTWSAQFTDPRKMKPAFSVINDNDSNLNEAGQILFVCADSREISPLPKGEVKVRGPFISYCSANEVVTTWPTSASFGGATPSSPGYHRAACAKIIGERYTLKVEPGSPACQHIPVRDRKIAVITAYMTDTSLSGMKHIKATSAYRLQPQDRLPVVVTT